MAKFIDLAGQTFGHWTALTYLGEGKWSCRCSCGAIAKIRGDAVKRGDPACCVDCRGGRTRDWPTPKHPQDDAVILAMRGEAKTYGEIASFLGRSRHSVIGRAHRIGVPMGESPIKVSSPAPKRTRVQMPQPIPRGVQTLPTLPSLMNWTGND